MYHIRLDKKQKNMILLSVLILKKLNNIALSLVTLKCIDGKYNTLHYKFGYSLRIITEKYTLMTWCSTRLSHSLGSIAALL